MRAEYLRFGVSGFFFSMAVLLFLRDELLPGLLDHLQPDRLLFGAWFALVLAGWNAARGYQIVAERRDRQNSAHFIYRPKSDEVEPYVPNPELDFFKTTDETEPPHPPSDHLNGQPKS